MGKILKKILDVKGKPIVVVNLNPYPSDLIIDTTPITGGSTGAIFDEK